MDLECDMCLGEFEQEDIRVIVANYRRRNICAECYNTMLPVLETFGIGHKVLEEEFVKI